MPGPYPDPDPAAPDARDDAAERAAQRGADNARLTLVAHTSANYALRTRHNAATADVTLAFALDFMTAGEKLTKSAAGPRYAGFPLAVGEDPVLTARAVYRAVALQRRARVLNIAGNSLHTLAQQGIGQAAINMWLYGVLTMVHAHHPFERVISGGQTGVDTAGLVVALALGIQAEGTLPKGFRRRAADGRDFDSTEAAVRADVLDQTAQLRAQLASLRQP